MIKRLYSKDFDYVNRLLIDFYNDRPDIYGLMERDQNVYDEYADFIAHYTTNMSGKTVLDFGSGSHRIPNALAKKGFKQAIGLDFFSDEKLIEYSAQLEINSNLIRYENSKIPLANESVDVVSSLCVIEHIIDVEHFLNEMDRVLKPGGMMFIETPNWSGINIGIDGFFQILKGKKYWRFNSFVQPMSWIFRSIKWYFEARFAKNYFLLIEPSIKNNKIDFQAPDFDAVHLCQPISFKRYFRQKGYKTIAFNRGFGSTLYSKVFNSLFPNMATTNKIVLQKSNLYSQQNQGSPMSKAKYIHRQIEHNTNAAEVVVPHIINMLNPKSVVDIGCGLGTWLKVFKDNGVNVIKGFDGHHLNTDLIVVDVSCVTKTDLEKPFKDSIKYDLAVSLEVAEHLSEAAADNFVASIVNLADIVLFSAAVPDQGGQNHINEQLPSYWEAKFKKYDFHFYDVLRSEFWDNQNVDLWYRQNMFIVAKKGTENILPAPKPVHNIIHPEMFSNRLRQIENGAMGPGFAVKVFIKTFVRGIKKVLGAK